MLQCSNASHDGARGAFTPEPVGPVPPWLTCCRPSRRACVSQVMLSLRAPQKPRNPGFQGTIHRQPAIVMGGHGTDATEDAPMASPKGPLVW